MLPSSIGRNRRYHVKMHGHVTNSFLGPNWDFRMWEYH